MVIAESKPLAEILDMVKDFKKIMVAGCKGCVTVCCAGGEKEVAILASELRIARKAAGNELEVTEYTCERQCDPEYIEALDDLVKNADAVVSIACSCGAPVCGGPLSLSPGVSRPQHHQHRRGHGARRLEGILPGLRQLHHREFRRPVPHHPLRQATAERPLRRLFARASAKWAKAPSPASGS